MFQDNHDVVYAQMKERRIPQWNTDAYSVSTTITRRKKQLRNRVFSAAAFFCMGIAVVGVLQSDEEETIGVISQVTTDFEYDETLGRLQFVSNMLPESAMVFLSTSAGAEIISVSTPSEESITHAWSQQEPWIEFDCLGEVRAYGDASVMTVVKNHEDEFTVRLMHEEGIESIYSGLTSVTITEGDRVLSGEAIGTAAGKTGFELRKEGLSILPVFSEPD